MSEDYYQIFAHLYSRKLTKKTFGMIRKDFKAKTGKDLCILVELARTEIIRDMQALPQGQRGAKLRTQMGKLTDYSTWVRYCKR